MSVQLSSNLPWELANNIWAAQLNPIISNPLSSMTILKNIALATGSNTINHGLGRQMQGWVILDKDAAVDPYRSAPFNASTLTLTASAPVVVNIGVF